MAKRNQEPIQVRAFVTVGDREVDVDTLSPEMRRRLATELKLKYMNTLFRGQAVFTVRQRAGGTTEEGGGYGNEQGPGVADTA